MKLLRNFFALILFSATSLTHAFSILPVDGLWSVVTEQNLAVGRAINLEMSDKVLVVTMYAYNAQGAPTFYAGAAALSATNTAAVSLSEPQGGTCLGCAPTSGRLLSSPGVAAFEFTSSTTGFVTLPNEVRKAISKGAITRPAAPDGFRGTWAFSYVLDATLTVADTPVFAFNLGPTSNGNGLMASSDAKTGCELQNSGSLAGSVLCVKITTSKITDKTMILKMFGNRMDGVWYYTDTPAQLYLFTSHRILDDARNPLILKRAPEMDADNAALFATLRTAIEAASALHSGQ